MLTGSDREFAWASAWAWALFAGLEPRRETQAEQYAKWYAREYFTDADGLGDLPYHSHAWLKFLAAQDD